MEQSGQRPACGHKHSDGDGIIVLTTKAMATNRHWRDPTPLVILILNQPSQLLLKVALLIFIAIMTIPKGTHRSVETMVHIHRAVFSFPLMELIRLVPNLCRINICHKSM